jgi:hypothetical protein
MTPSITETTITDALGNFLTAILSLPASNIIVGQVNRVASPEGDYCVMWPLRRPRLSTNVDTSADAKFTGSIAGTVMTITTVLTGEMNVGATVFGVGVAANTIVSEQLTGTPGGAGTYTVGPSQTIGPITLSAGQTEIEQSTEVVYQIDVHGNSSGNNSQTIATLFRDAYGVSLFAGTGVTPLYCDEPRQMPFTTAADQFESRWMIDVHMQVDPVLSVPTQFADQANVTVVDVTEAFPA